MKPFRTFLQILLPLAILAGGFLTVMLILEQRKQPVVEPTNFQGPAVRVYTATAADLRIDVDTQGTVEPFRSIDLVAQVGGRVVEVSPALRAGGFFAPGDLLIAIEAADYELAVVQQQANVARAELRLLQERAEADAAVRAWKELEGERQAEPLVARIPQIRDAEANLAGAKAQLDKARLDLGRTKITAPFAGRVRSARVDLGQTVQPGQALAQLYGTEFAEVRLPIPTQDAGFVDLPMGFADGGAPAAGAPVEFTAEFGGARYTWAGTIVRTEGEIDRRSRQLTVVARVEAPYARGDQPDRPPLAVGMFVQARIQGRLFRDVVALPRAALRGRDEVWVVDAERRLVRRRVDVLRAEADRVLLRAGVARGESVCITSLETPTDGMPVRPTEGTETPTQSTSR